MKTLIYTQRVELVESYNERRDCADQRIADYIYACGFLPIPIPNDAQITEKIVYNLRPSGIVLTGGNSLQIYGGNAPERDETDKKLIELSIKENIPLLGFCRGMQSILDYFGNSLEDVSGHVAVRHMINTGEDSYEVNSYHNQACKGLSENCGLVVLAMSDDGVIESVRHEQYQILGIMWHPEREDKYAQRDIDMMKALFENGEITHGI